jgi:hypothetical protein
MKGRNNLALDLDALSILLRRSAGGPVAVVCPVAVRPQPIRRSSLASIRNEMAQLRQQGKTLEEIADWIASVTGHRPNRSTVLRQIRIAGRS